MNEEVGTFSDLRNFSDYGVEEKIIGDRKYVKLGIVEVMSKYLIVCDPCRISDDLKESVKEKLASEDNYKYQLKYTWGRSGLGIVFSSGYGSGRYAVYGMLDPEGRIASVLVEMIDLEK